MEGYYSAAIKSVEELVFLREKVSEEFAHLELSHREMTSIFRELENRYVEEGKLVIV